MNMKQVYRFDENGFYIEPVIIKENESIPQDCTEVDPTQGIFKAKFIDGQWIEGLSQEEIDVIKNTPPPITEVEQLQKDQADLVLQLVVKGVL